MRKRDTELKQRIQEVSLLRQLSLPRGFNMVIAVREDKFTAGGQVHVREVRMVSEVTMPIEIMTVRRIRGKTRLVKQVRIIRMSGCQIDLSGRLERSGFLVRSEWS